MTYCMLTVKLPGWQILRFADVGCCSSIFFCCSVTSSAWMVSVSRQYLPCGEGITCCYDNGYYPMAFYSGREITSANWWKIHLWWNLSQIACQMMLCPQILWRKLSRIATKPRNLRNFCPQKFPLHKLCWKQRGSVCWHIVHLGKHGNYNYFNQISKVLRTPSTWNMC